MHRTIVLWRTAHLRPAHRHNGCTATVDRYGAVPNAPATGEARNSGSVRRPGGAVAQTCGTGAATARPSGGWHA